MRATPIHSRRVTAKPKIRSATTVRNTRPPAITDWTSEIGARESAATWRPQLAVATRIPITYHFDRNSARELAIGRLASTGGDSTAPRCL